MYPLQLCIFDVIAVSPVYFPVEFIPLNQPLIVGLIPPCQQLEDLRNWVSALDLHISYWYQLTEP